MLMKISATGQEPRRRRYGTCTSRTF